MRQNSPLATLLLHAGIATGIFLTLISIRVDREPIATVEPPPPEYEAHTIDIAVEHNGNGSLRLDISTLKGDGIAEIDNTSPDTMTFTLPDTWRRTAVRHASLAKVQSHSPSLGFTNWTLPSGAGISFAFDHVPEHVLIHNPIKEPLKVQFYFVDLNTETIVGDTILMDDDAVQLW